MDSWTKENQIRLIWYYMNNARNFQYVQGKEIHLQVGLQLEASDTEKAERLCIYFAPVFSVKENNSQTEKGKNKCCFKVAGTKPGKRIDTEHLATLKSFDFWFVYHWLSGGLNGKRRTVSGPALEETRKVKGAGNQRMGKYSSFQRE